MFGVRLLLSLGWCDIIILIDSVLNQGDGMVVKECRTQESRLGNMTWMRKRDAFRRAWCSLALGFFYLAVRVGFKDLRWR